MVRKEKSQGQILIVQAFCMFLIVLLFMHSVRFADALKYKQETQFKADLVAVSVARVQAEHLQLIGAINSAMLIQMDLIYLSMIVGIYPPAAPVAIKLIKRFTKSINNLGKFLKKLNQATPILIYYQAQIIARANGFQGAFIAPIWPKLPLKESRIKLISDSFELFSENPITGMNNFVKDFQDMLSKITDDNFSDIGKNLNDKLLKKLSKLLGRIQAGPLYLDDRYQNQRITVFCFDEEKNVQISSARVSHYEIPRSEEGDISKHPKNNYVNFNLKSNNVNGFQVELTSVPDIMEKLPNLDKHLDKIFKALEALPGDNPVSKEILKLIQH